MITLCNAIECPYQGTTSCHHYPTAYQCHLLVGGVELFPYLQVVDGYEVTVTPTNLHVEDTSSVPHFRLRNQEYLEQDEEYQLRVRLWKKEGRLPSFPLYPPYEEQVCTD